MATTNRMLIVKAVEYDAKKSTKHDWQPPRIEDELREIAKKALTVSNRHYPKDPKTVNNGVRCNFINGFNDLKSQGVLFTVCSYVKGHAPEAFSPELNEASVDVDVIKLTDSAGNHKELAYIYRVLAFGQIIIVENVMGSGGVGALQKLLRLLMREIRGKDYPAIKFTDIESEDLRELIKSKNGIKAVRATVLHSMGSSTSRFSRPLSDVHGAVSGTNRCVVSWEADAADSIDIEDGMDLLDDPAVSTVSVQFNSGGGFTSLETYRERKPVKLQVTPEGRVAVTEVQTHLLDYLYELRDPDHQGPIDHEGHLRKKLQLIGTK